MNTRWLSPRWLTGLLTACTVAVPALCWAGAWTQGEGKLYTRLSLNAYFTDREFDDDGDRRDLPESGEFRDLNLGSYLEYGLTDRVTLLGSLYYKHLRKDDDLRETQTWGIGDIDVAGRVRLARADWGVTSLQGLVKIPEAYDQEDDVPLGNGQYDVEVRFLYGRSLWPWVPGYCNLEAGYRWRAEEPSDEIRYLAELGGDLAKRFYARAKLDGIYSMDNGTRQDAAGNPAATNNFDLGKLDLTLGYRMTGAWMLEAGYAPALYGQNTSAGATYTLALAYQAP